MKAPHSHHEHFRRAAILGGALLLALFVMHGIYGADGLRALHQKHRQYKSLTQQITNLKQENGRLQKEVKNLQSNPATIERYAREELHMARKNEIIYMLPQKPQPPSGSAALAKPHASSH